MIVVLAYISSAFAQDWVGVNPNNYESHWSFNYHNYLLQKPFVSAITIDGQVVTLDNENWSDLEVAAFITNADGQEECRSNMMWLTDEYVLEYEDPYLTIDGFPIYYTTPGGTVYFKMYDHANNIEYTECTITYLGEPYTVTAGTPVSLGWGDGLEPVMLNFTTSTEPTCGIELNADGVWTENFESATNTELLPLEQHDACWTWTRLVELPADYQDTLPHLYYKADDDAHAQFAHDNYSLRLWNRGTYAMPVLDEDININDLKMSFYVRQSYSFYSLLVGVMDDPTDAETFVPVAFVDNGESTNMEYFEFNFANYQGEGRYIAFKNVRPSGTSFDGQWHDVHSVNYIDDITLTYMEDNDCVLSLPFTETFEEITGVTTKLTGANPDCWGMVQFDVDNMPFDKLPQVYCQNSTANSGNYSLRMVNRGVYALPEMELDYGIQNVHLEMYVRQPNANYQLQVGVWNGQEFTPVALVNNSGTDYEFVQVSFSNYEGDANRIAFRNTLNGGFTWDYSYNYIDDITVYETSTDCAGIMVEHFDNFDSYAADVVTPATGIKPDCWDVVVKDVDMAYNMYPQIYNSENFAYSGASSLRMADRCVFAMPFFAEDEVISNLHLSMYLRQPSAFYTLEVGVWVENNGAEASAGEFIPVATFDNANADVTFVECDFSNYEGSNYGRIAFRNTLKGGKTWNYSYNYIDDVRLYYGDDTRNNASDENVIDNMNVDRYLESIAVYPNPTVGELHIGAVDVQKVECYNQMGQLVAVYNNARDIDINGLANGVYTLRITVPQGVTMRKVVKE